MKLAIMQPYFFPYLGYFSLINQVDEFIIFDTPQFMRKGWIERNRIIKLTGGSVYIKVPLLKAELSTSIKDMRIDIAVNWQDKILSQLDIYKKKAPFYAETKALVQDCLQGDFTSIVEVNSKLIEKVSNYLGLNTTFKIYSEMELAIEEPNAPDEWALNICKALGVSNYVNASGGQEFFDKNKYEKDNINLFYVKQPIDSYKQLGNDFEPGLSIIDVMMFNSPLEIRDMLSQGYLEKA